MWSFLAKVDPNTVIGVLTLFGSVGGWLWHKARGEATSSFAETINGAIDSIVFEMFGELTDDEASRANVQGYLASIRARVERHVWTVLAKRNVPRNPTTERLVHAAIERASGMLARELAERRARVASQRDPRVTVSK